MDFGKQKPLTAATLLALKCGSRLLKGFGMSGQKELLTSHPHSSEGSEAFAARARRTFLGVTEWLKQ